MSQYNSPHNPYGQPQSGLAPEKNGKATAALLLGIFAVLTGCFGVGLILGIIALVLGMSAVREIDDPATNQTGRGAAQWGVILGCVSIGLAVLVPIAALLMGILLPALGAARRTARQMQSNTQVRSIHQGMVSYAQGNRSYFPGLTSGGQHAPTNAYGQAGISVENRFFILMDQGFFPRDYAISPTETKSAWIGGQVDPQHYSYAMLQVPAGTPGSRSNPGRYDEWNETLNTEAPVMSDRNTGSVSAPQSLHTNTPGDWRGTVAWNDNHTMFETTHEMSETWYGNGPRNRVDHLFDEQTQSDALMIYSGN